MSSYDAVKLLVKERPECFDVVQACYEISGEIPEFAGAWVFWRHRHLRPQSLRPLSCLGILKKTDTSRRGNRAYYRMVDRESVGLALRDFGNINK
jgi:hypothetical protein